MLANADLASEYRSILNDDAAGKARLRCNDCLLYTSDAADE